jgi:hypothetical protein
MPPTASAPHSTRTRQQIGKLEALRLERETLEEEVRQLKAAVKIYTAVVQRLAITAQRSLVH